MISGTNAIVPTGGGGRTGAPNGANNAVLTGEGRRGGHPAVLQASPRPLPQGYAWGLA